MTVHREMQSVAERIELLVRRFAAATDPEIRRDARELVRLMMEMYGVALEKIVRTLQHGGAGSAGAVEALLRDELVASLLVLHDLHPEPPEVRVARELERVRPLAGVNATLVELTGGVARVRVRSERSGRSKVGTDLPRLIEGIVEAAAPEVVRVEIEGLEETAAPVLVQLTRTPALSPPAPPPKG